jgi:acetyl/propionyl-CoA carboxylase alpha subunit
MPPAGAPDHARGAAEDGRVRRMIRSVLIANRGEIACRIARTCGDLGIRTVAVFSDADEGALHVRSCDTAVHLAGNAPADTYLRADLLIDAARRAGADAVHPGYGFLAESATFAQAVIDAGLTWIGPPPAAMEAMGTKVGAKALMRSAGVPVLPVSCVVGADDIPAIGFPLMVMASAGGGGRGMRVVARAADLDDALASAGREAAAAFGDGTVFCERYVERGRHIEVQVFGDQAGTVVALPERECSIQRRHQKIVEESPSPAVDDVLRRHLSEAAIAAASAVGYVGAGTVEFLLDPDGAFWFLEMNTRLQVEHPVTEAITGLDLVAAQLSIADGATVADALSSGTTRGHAIEVRLTAEDPAAGYRPSVGTFARFEDRSTGVRIDTGIESGSTVSPFYDSMVAKVIAHGATRAEAIRRLDAWLATAQLHGPVTNRDQLRNILRHPEFVAGNVHTGFLDEHPCSDAIRGDVTLAAAAATLTLQAANRAGATVLAAVPSGFRNNPAVDQVVELALDETPIRVAYRLGRDGHVTVDGTALAATLVAATPDTVVVDDGGLRRTFRVAGYGDQCFVDAHDGHVTFTVLPRHPDPGAGATAGSLVAPMPGNVLRVLVGPGDTVTAGQPLVVVEAMKMEHQVLAPADGTVASVHVTMGEQVDTGQVLLQMEDTP